MGRRVALLLSVLVLLVVVVARDDRGEPFTAPAGMRWAGYNGFVVAVPDTWPSIQQQPCQPPVPEVVTYAVPGSFRGLCHIDGPGQSPALPRLWVGTSINWERDLKKTWQPIAVGDDVGYLSHYLGDTEHPKSQGVFTRAFEIPGKVMFEASAPTKRELLQILRSVREVPPDLRLVPRLSTSGGRPMDMALRLRAAGFRVRQVVEPPPGWMLHPVHAGFVRTDPPVGTPIAQGTTVTLYSVE